MTQARSSMSIMEADDVILFVGGEPTTNWQLVDIYDAKQNIWRPQIRLDHSAIFGSTVDSKAVLICTDQKGTPKDTVYIYDVNSEELVQVPISFNFTVSGISRRSWRSLTTGSKVYFYNDQRMVIVDPYLNTSYAIQSHEQVATTNGTHIIMASNGDSKLYLLNLETLQWTIEVMNYIPLRIMALFYDDTKQLIFIEETYLKTVKLDQLDEGPGVLLLAEPALVVNQVDRHTYIAGENGISVMSPIVYHDLMYVAPLVYYQLGSLQIKPYSSAVYNGSIYYTSTLNAVYQMKFQSLFTEIDMQTGKETDKQLTLAANGFYFYFNKLNSSIHYYNLANGQLDVIHDRNFSESFTLRDVITSANQLLVLRYPEYITFDFTGKTWTASIMPYHFSHYKAINKHWHTVFYNGYEPDNLLYLFDGQTHQWTELQAPANYTNVFLYSDVIALFTVDNSLQLFANQQWHQGNFSSDPINQVSTLFQYESTVCLTSTVNQTSTLFMYDVMTHQKTVIRRDIILGDLVNTYGNFIVFAGPVGTQVIQLNIFNVVTKNWNVVDLPTKLMNTPIQLGINNNIAYVAIPNLAQEIDLVTLEVHPLAIPIEVPADIWFIGNKIIFLSVNYYDVIYITMLENTTKSFTSVQYYSPGGLTKSFNFQTTEDYLIASIDSKQTKLQFPVLLNSIMNQALFIGQSANFTVNPIGKSFSHIYWTDQDSHLISEGNTLLLNNISLSEAGTYTVKIVDQCQQEMHQSVQLSVYDKPVIASILTDVIALCNDSATVSTKVVGEQVELYWTVDGRSANVSSSVVNISTANYHCESSHQLCVTATNPSGSAQSCSLLEVLLLESIFKGPYPEYEQVVWFSDSKVKLLVEVLDSECLNHTWLMNGVSMGVYGTHQSEIMVQISTKTEHTVYEVEAQCLSNVIRSRPYKFTHVTSLTPISLSLIIIGISLAIVVPVVISIVIFRRRLGSSRQKQADLEMLLSRAKTESIRGKDNLVILQPTTWEWTPSDEYTFKSVDHLPVNVDFTALNSSFKSAIEVDMFVQGDVVFSSKQTSVKKGVKKPLLGSSCHIDIYAPKSPKYEIIVEPSSFDVTARSPVQVTVSSKLRMTAKCTICLIVVCEQEKTYSAIEFKLESKPSMWIDLEEVNMTNEFLGGGGFGSVTRGNYRGQDVAVKKLNLALQLMDEHTFDEFEREVSLMKGLRHPNIVQFVGASNVQNNLAIVIEIAPFGSLASVMQKQQLSHGLKLTMLLETAKALQFLHSNGIVHRDIKPHNVLVFSLEPKAAVHVKLTDFGTARFVPENETNVTRNIGTSAYMAPESMGKNPKITKSADVYSFAILMWQVVFEQTPFDDFQWQHDIEKHVLSGDRLPIPQSHLVQPEIVELIKDCWQQDPSNRPNITSVAQRIAAILN